MPASRLTPMTAVSQLRELPSSRPAKRLDPSTQEPETAPLSEHETHLLPPRRVALILEDIALQTRWSAELRRTGLAPDIIEAETAHRNPEFLDGAEVVIVDLDRPGAMSLMDKLRRRNDHVLLIGASDTVSDALKLAAQRAGMDTCVPKRCVASTLLRHVRRAQIDRYAESMLGMLLPGTPYLLQSILGRGGCAIVYAAIHTDLETEVAVKLSIPGPDVDRTNAGLLSEARILARLAGHAVPEVYDFRRMTAGNNACVMQRVAGATLATRLGRGPLAFMEAVEIMLQLLRTLAAAHSKRICHLDLKPGNIMVNDVSTGVKLTLLDFGLAMAPNGRDLRGCTPSFAAPEQIRRERCDERADIFAVGGIFDSMLTAKLPTARGPRACLEIPSEIRSAVQRWIRRCRAHDPMLRYADAAEARHALLDALEGYASLPRED